MDETSIKVKKVGMYLYREVDLEESALEFLCSASRDAKTVKRFFVKALYSAASSAPQAHPIHEAGGPARCFGQRLTLVKYTVIAITRHPETLTDLHVALRLPLDDTDLASVASATEAVVRRFGRIDILVFRVYFMQTFGSL